MSSSTRSSPGNPKATVSADELEPDAHPAHPRPRRPLRRHRRASPSARARRCWRSSRSPTSSRSWAWRTSRPEPRRHRRRSTGAGSSSSPRGTPRRRRTGTVCTPAGLLIHVGDKLVYHLGDTALFSDLELIAERGNHVDVALVPIGGHYTMDRFDAVTACEFIGADTSIPVHYDTFPPIETDAQAFKSDVENATESKVSCSRRARRTRCGDPRHRPDRGRARRRCPTLGGALADVEGVAEAWSVTGEWDFVAMLRVRTPEEIAEVVTGRPRAGAGDQAHAHDGRVRGLLPARPRGAVQHRDVTSSGETARRLTANGPRAQRCATARTDAAVVPVVRRARRRGDEPVSASRAAAATTPAPASSTPVAPWWQRWPRIQRRLRWAS